MRKIIVSLATMSLAFFSLQPGQASQLPYELEVVADVNSTKRISHALSTTSLQIGDRFYWMEYVDPLESYDVYYSENQVAHRVQTPIDWEIIDIFEFDSKLMLAVGPLDDPDGNIYIAEFTGERFNLFDEVYLPIDWTESNFASLQSYGGVEVVDSTLYFSGCDDTNGCAIWSYESEDEKPELFSDVDQNNNQTPIGLFKNERGYLDYSHHPSGEYVQVESDIGDYEINSNIFQNGYIALDAKETGGDTYFDVIKDSDKRAIIEIVPTGFMAPAAIVNVTDTGGSLIEDIDSSAFVSGNAYFTTLSTEKLWVYTGQDDISAATVRAVDTGITATNESVGLVAAFGEHALISINEADGDIRWVSFDGGNHSSPTTLATLDASDATPRNVQWALGMEKAGSFDSKPVIIASGEKGAELFTVDLSGVQPVLSPLSMPFAATYSAELLDNYVVGDTVVSSYSGLDGAGYRSVTIKNGVVNPIDSIGGSDNNLVVTSVATGSETSYVVFYNGGSNSEFLAEFDGENFTRVPVSDFPGASGNIEDVAYFDDRFWVINQDQGVYVSKDDGFVAVNSHYGSDFDVLRGSRGSFVENIDGDGLYVVMKNTGNVATDHYFVEAGDPISIHRADPGGSSDTAMAGLNGNLLISQFSAGPQLQNIKANTKTPIIHAGTTDSLGNLHGATTLDGVTYLVANDANQDWRLYRLDGTEASPAFEDDLVLSSYWDGFLTSDDEKLWFGAFEGGGFYSAIYTFDGEELVKVAQKEPGFYSHPHSPIFLGDRLLFSDISMRFGTTLFGLTEPALPAFSAPVPFDGPVVVSQNQGESLRITGRNLQSVTSVSIGGQNVEFEMSNDTITASLSELENGEYSVELVHANGVLKLDQKVFIEKPPSLESPSAKFWTKQISPTEIKLYAKNIVGAGKVQFFHNGNEVAWVRAEDASDEKLSVITSGPMTGANYLVRTRELVEGKNVFEIYVDGERVLRRAQGN